MQRPSQRTASDRIRAIGFAAAETAEVVGRAESRLARTIGEVGGEASRAVGSAAARTAEEMRPGTGEMVNIVADAGAQAIEAGGRLAGDVLDAGAVYARDMTESATGAAISVLASRETDGDSSPEAPLPPTLSGPT